MCIGHRDTYFDDSLEALEIAQSLCVRCPLFQDCTRWTLSQPFHYLEDGIFAGLTPVVRMRILTGKVEYYDWRREWNRRHFARKRARQRLRQVRGKRRAGKTVMPPCATCGSTDNVCRNGMNGPRTRQRYRCTDCQATFYGEELV